MDLKGYINTITGGKLCQENVPIIFSDQDLEMVKQPHADPLVIKLHIRDEMVSKVLVDEGSSSDIIF